MRRGLTESRLPESRLPQPGRPGGRIGPGQGQCHRTRNHRHRRVRRPGDERKAALFGARSAANPARRVGTADDIAAAALAALTNGFLTGVSIPVDGGEHLV
jgi:NAD(P)-dependent dehydrogenase (short-subunit alcohol dehydrogenase family)